jgi:N-dimethylarginine dimethylaminohydrolase
MIGEIAIPARSAGIAISPDIMKNPTQNAAYGGTGWQPRTQSLSDEIGTVWAECGIDSEYLPLRKVLLHRPGAEIAVSQTDFNAAQMLAPLDLGLAQAQHDAMAQAYRDNGVEVIGLGHPGAPTPNQMFMADVFVMTPAGAIVARPASVVRAGEERWAARAIAGLGMPIVASIGGHGTFEGADLTWVTPSLALVARGVRTNDEAFAQIKAILGVVGAEAVQVDLPFGTMHLMGNLRLVDADLAIGWPTRLPHRAVDALKANGYRMVWIPDEEEAKVGYALNFVILGPRKILMPANCPVTQAFYEALGITCVTVDISELGKAAGSAGCLTGILRRDMRGA